FFSSKSDYYLSLCPSRSSTWTYGISFGTKCSIISSTECNKPPGLPRTSITRPSIPSSSNLSNAYVNSSDVVSENELIVIIPVFLPSTSSVSASTVSIGSSSLVKVTSNGSEAPVRCISKSTSEPLSPRLCSTASFKSIFSHFRSSPC